MGNACVPPDHHAVEICDTKDPQGKQMLEISDSEDSTVDTLGGLSNANKVGIWCVSSSLTRESSRESICDSSSEVGDSSQQPGCSSEQLADAAPKVRTCDSALPQHTPEVRPVGQNVPVVQALPVTPMPVAKASPVTPILTCGSSLPQHTLDCCELKLDRTPFDPTEPQLKRRLLELLRIGAESRIEKLGGPRGGNNSGIWFVRSSCAELIIKLVSTGRREGARLMSLASKYPSVAQDRGLAFPTKIVRCSVNGAVQHELVVMPKVKGEDFSVFIGESWWSGRPNAKNEVFRAMEQLGRQLKEFHIRYGDAQHGDFQPSNVFYDKNANAFTFIDLADMGPQVKLENDVQQFKKSVNTFGYTYGAEFEQQSLSCFGRGYASL